MEDRHKWASIVPLCRSLCDRVEKYAEQAEADALLDNAFDDLARARGVDPEKEYDTPGKRQPERPSPIPSIPLDDIPPMPPEKGGPGLAFAQESTFGTSPRLSASIFALEKGGTIKTLPLKFKAPNHRRPWMFGDEDKLKRLISDGVSVTECQNIFGRSRKSLYTKARSMGYAFPQQSTRDDRKGTP